MNENTGPMNENTIRSSSTILDGSPIRAIKTEAMVVEEMARSLVKYPGFQESIVAALKSLGYSIAKND